MKIWIFVFFTLFIALLFLAAFKSFRRGRSTQEFMLAGSNVGVILGFLTFSATLFSAFTFQGMPDFFRVHGIGAWIFLAFSDGVMVFFILWFGRKLRKKAAKFHFEGVAGLMTKIYRNKWAGYLLFANAFLFLIPYAAIQIRGISIFLDAAFPDIMPWWGWSLILVGTMLIYSEVGGFKAIVYGDAIQGVILLTVIWIIGSTCISKAGGIVPLFEGVKAVNEKLLSIPGPNNLFTRQFLIASMISVVMIPVTQPQLTKRLVVMRDLKAMVRMSYAVGIFAIVIISATIFIGMYGAMYYPEATTTEFLSRALLFDQAAPVAGLAVVGLFAACLSTTNAQIFALGNELRSLLSGSDRKILRMTRLSILLFAIIVMLFASVMSNELALLARVSFIGTSMMAPVVLIAVIHPEHPGTLPLYISLSAFVTIILSIFGIIPAMIGQIRLEIIIYVLFFGFIVFYTLYHRKKEQRATMVTNVE
jgi:SSS family solute:Na+ symporter